MGERVRIRLPGEKQWTSGKCIGKQGPRSYIVRVGEVDYGRNRWHLLKGGSQPSEEPEILQMPRLTAEGGPSSDDSQSRAGDAEPHTDPLEPMRSPVEETQPTLQQPKMLSSPPSVRRSSRQRKAPDWITTYVPSCARNADNQQVMGLCPTYMSLAPSYTSVNH